MVVVAELPAKPQVSNSVADEAEDGPWNLSPPDLVVKPMARPPDTRRRGRWRRPEAGRPTRRECRWRRRDCRPADWRGGGDAVDIDFGEVVAGAGHDGCACACLGSRGERGEGCWIALLVVHDQRQGSYVVWMAAQRGVGGLQLGRRRGNGDGASAAPTKVWR